MFVKDVMSKEVTVVQANHSLESIVSTMTQERHSCMTIVENGQPIGIVTERDLSRLLAQALNQRCDPLQPISNVMTPNPICVSQDMRLIDALALSRTRRLRHLPVVDKDNCLIGLVTQTHMVNTYADVLATQVKLETNLEELKLLSLEDPLMNIGNRRAMEVDLSFTEADAKRHQKYYSIALIDIDYFKKYNDFYGHQQGDEALRQVADIIRTTVRESDRVFRYGGEEILVLMPETELQDAQLVVERIRAAHETAAIDHEKAPLGFLTVSAGVAAGKACLWKELVSQSDEALYAAKAAGRNRVCV